MRLLMVHGSGQNELTYHYQTARFPDADAVNLPGSRGTVSGVTSMQGQLCAGNRRPS